VAVAEVSSARGRQFEAAVEKLRVGVQAMSACVRDADGETLGEALIQIREAGIDPLEAAFATGVRRFDKSGEYKADGALSLTAWLRWKCKLSGGAAMERVEIARQLEKLPATAAAFANGDVGFQHVAVLARTAEHVGAAAVRKDEASLLKAAQTMDPGQFTTVAKNYEHRVDAAGALAEANRAYERRYFHISEPQDGLVRLDGVLDAEGGATLRTALQAYMKPVKDDARSYGQRSADALVELGRQGSGGKRDGAGPRPLRRNLHRSFQPIVVMRGHVAAVLIQFVDIAQFDPADRRLDFIEPKIVADELMHILRPLAVVAQHSQFSGES